METSLSKGTTSNLLKKTLFNMETGCIIYGLCTLSQNPRNISMEDALYVCASTVASTDTHTTVTIDVSLSFPSRLQTNGGRSVIRISVDITHCPAKRVGVETQEGGGPNFSYS